VNVLLWAAVMLIGGTGPVLRFLVDGLAGSVAGRDFPAGTLLLGVTAAWSGELIGAHL
jgi:fluoride exporter